MRNADSAMLPPAAAAEVVRQDGGWPETDPHMLRIRRLGARLFGVANCLIVFQSGDGQLACADGDGVGAEYAFCASFPLSAEPTVIPDMAQAPAKRQRGAAAQCGHIRFFAAHPVFNHEGMLAGRICLVDHAPRPGFGISDVQA
ncbi:GAF domain-containing protein, partial [Oxalobacteraceae bacterium OM1]